MNSHRLLTTALFAMLVAIVTGCMDTGTTSQLPACPHMLGQWTSLEYDVLIVYADDTQDFGTGYVSVFDVDKQQGCEFSGNHTWDNGTDKQSSHFIGIVDPSTHKFTLIEPSTSSRYMGHVDGDTMDLVFLHYAPDLSFTLAYSTSLARDDGEATARDCPNIMGSWHSNTYDVLLVSTDGSTELSSGWSANLEVQSQTGCVFRARDAWTDGTTPSSAALAGVIHGDGRTISMIEVPRATHIGPIGLVSGLLHDANHLDLNFIGELSDSSANIAFTTNFSQTGAPHAHAPCANISGTWSGGPFEAFRISNTGTASSVQRTARELVVSDQVACMISGQNRWAGEDGVMNSEYFVGLIDEGSQNFTIMELDPHPEDGTTAVITNRLLKDNSVLSIYTGKSSDNTFAQVFAEVLERQ